MSLKMPAKIFLILFLVFFSSRAYSASPATGRQEETANFAGEINSDNINVRLDATVNSPVICTLRRRSRVEVLGESYDWYKIRLPKKAPSYITKSLVECIKIGTETGRCENGKVLGNRVNVRSAPNETGAILGQIDENEIVDIIQEKQGWYRIVPIQNSFVWVHKKFVNKSRKAIPAAKEKKIAKEPAPSEDILPGPQENIAEENITVEGIIRPYGKVFKRAATHRLILPDKTSYLLKGDKKSLDSLNYHKVKVTGRKLILPKQKFSLIDVKILEVVD